MLFSVFAKNKIYQISHKNGSTTVVLSGFECRTYARVETCAHGSSQELTCVGFLPVEVPPLLHLLFEEVRHHLVHQRLEYPVSPGTTTQKLFM